MKFFKHIMLLLLISICMMLVITGCGGATSNYDNGHKAEETALETSNTEQKNSLSTPDGFSEVKKFIDSTGREIEVPVHPQKIASFEFTGYLIALGVKPVATSPRFLKEPFLEFVEGAEDLGYPASLEKLLEVDPDLIIAPDYLTPEQVEAYEKIAPVVLLKWSETNNLNRLTALADLLDRQDEEKQWLKSYEKLVEETRERLTTFLQPGETATVFYAWGNTINLLAPQVISTLFDDVGFEPSERMKQRLDKDKDFASETISKEGVIEYAADRMFFIAEGELGESLLKELQEGVLKTLPAVQEGKMYLLDPNWYSFEPVLLEWQLNDAVDILTREKKAEE